MIKERKKMPVALSQVSLGLRGDTIGVFRPKAHLFSSCPKSTGHGVPEGLAASHKALTICRRQNG